MKAAIFNNKPRLCRSVAIAGILAALVLSILTPYKMREPDSWAYYYAAENFSHGRLVVDHGLHRQQVNDAWEQVGNLIQYAPLEDGNWALESQPRYIYAAARKADVTAGPIFPGSNASPTTNTSVSGAL
jgi:hypothetical protein